MTLYPRAVERLLQNCKDYRAGRISLGLLMRAILNAAEQIAAVEEKQLRRHLEQAEGELDTLEFTTDSSALFDAAVAVVVGIEAELCSALPSE